ncbi:hypothetical protein [Luteibacter rhizovicinus]|uniref:hypothetical protein n=1 Tax=Luteibacter rhizovicinus TaxID=242606 RepID=UPI001A9FF515|nr:hypothetical protein [Luteibacter rhizovicinus]
MPLAWLAGWFVRLGLQASDAYAAADALWLIVGYVGAHRFARALGAKSGMAALAAAAWMTLPMIWAHQSYSSLALGMALLPLYLSSALALFDLSTASFRRQGCAAAIFVALCVIALFMDGYTFMMFAVASAILLAFRFIASPVSWPGIARGVLPAYLVGFGGAYLLYTGYMGQSAFSPAPLDFFRGWALDLTFLIKPSQGEFWLWDWLGWSRARSDSVFFGDASVWITTFALPLSFIGLGCFLAVRKHDRRAWLLLVVALFGLYMSLGPSLKIGAVKPDGASGPFMQAEAGLMPTGNAFVSEHIPGFRAMRAAYRWEALFLLGMWGLVVLGAARARPRHGWVWTAVYVLLIVSSMPHLVDMSRDYRNYRRDLATIDREVAAPLAARISVGSKVFFMPFGNDVMANYLSPRLGVIAYNVGGDKQIEIARDRWPPNLQKFAMNRFGLGDLPAIRATLLDHEVDAVIIPYFDSLWAAHLWPCVAEAKGYSALTLALFDTNRSFLCPAQIKAAYAGNVEALRKDALLSVDEQPLFSIVTLKPMYASEAGRREARAKLLSGVHYPLDIVNDVEAADAVLGNGWHDKEPVNRWSGASADLTIPVPAECKQGGCTAEFHLLAFAATPQRPVSVSLAIVDVSGVSASPVSATMLDDAVHTLAVPVPEGRSVVTLHVDVPAATSPAALGMSVDSRVLGASLRGIDFRQQ